MGLFSNVSTWFGRAHRIERFVQGKADLSDTESRDFADFGDMVRSAAPEDLLTAFTQAAPHVRPSEMLQEISEGQREGDQFGGFDRTSVAKIARELIGAIIGKLGPGFSLSELIHDVPLLRRTDPEQMDANETASLAEWTRQNHPDAFGQAAKEIAVKEPGLLPHLLGKQGISAAASELAKLLIRRTQH